MFILRNINADGTEFNHVLGEEYQLITKEQSPLLFEEINAQYKQQNKSVVAYIHQLGNYPTRTFPISRDDKNYIMTDSGKTFSNLSYK